MAAPIEPNQWLHRGRTGETEAVAAFHRSEAMRYSILATYAKHNTSFGEAVALERLAEKHRILALS